jgi:zinc protease
MRRASLLFVLCGIAYAAAATRGAEAPLAPPDIPFTKTVLGNGLTLIVNEDHKAPVVAIDLWYHVGAKNEPPGRTGFAHLFEHLMFGATGGNQRAWFERLEDVGATDINGTTNNDRTNFFETVPTSALDLALAMEAQRMGHLLDQLDDSLLNTQRGVVENEKRQSENRPYALSNELTAKTVWPSEHPYAHTVIGDMADLEAAKLSDVKEWFTKYYGPSNAVIVLAGDISPEAARRKVETYFAAIPPGPPVVRQKQWVARRRGEQRAEAQDRVAAVRVSISWNTPPQGSADNDSLDVLTSVLSQGKDSRLYRRLVYQDQTATEVEAYVDAREIGGLTTIRALVKPGADAHKVEAAMHEELARLLRDGPTAAELQRITNAHAAQIIRQLEEVGGFSGKADLLARSETLFGRPGAWRDSFIRQAHATPAVVSAAGRRWLSDGSFTLVIAPFPTLAAAPAAGAAELPTPGPTIAPSFPKVERATLSNGLKLIFAERHSAPTVDVAIITDAGDAADPADRPGLSRLTFTTLMDGPADLDALAFEDRQMVLGATLDGRSNWDTATVSMRALSARLDPSLDLLADLVLHPGFRPADVSREKELALAQIRQSRQSPRGILNRLVPTLAFGSAHPYGHLATEASTQALTREAMIEFYRRWSQPASTTIIVVGDTTLAAIAPKLEARFGTWKNAGNAAHKSVPSPAPAPAQTVYLVDRPGAQQSLIAALGLTPPKSGPDHFASEAMNSVLGGSFTSRLNLNLRENKHWSYGAWSVLADARTAGFFEAASPVQTDKTAESFAEIRRELSEISSNRPPSSDELKLAQRNLTLTLPGQWQTNDAIDWSLQELVANALPEDYWPRYADRINALTGGDLARAARNLVRPETLAWLVIGDAAKVRAPLEALGLTITPIDADGKPTP